MTNWSKGGKPLAPLPNALDPAGGPRTKRRSGFTKGDSAGATASVVTLPSSHPVQRNEVLYTNLVKVVGIASRVYVAPTELSDLKAVYAALREIDKFPPDAWCIHGGAIYSFHDLRKPLWASVCDASTVEEHETIEWSGAEDKKLQRLFVLLANKTLAEYCRSLRLHSHRKRQCFYFPGNRDLRLTEIIYESRTGRRAKRSVFLGVASHRAPGMMAYYRHLAFEGHFLRISGSWYLEIVPTWVFTTDGKTWDRFYEDKLKGIRKLERNLTVLQQTYFWSWMLKGRSDLFTPKFPFLEFGELLVFKVGAGIEDGVWLTRDDEETSPASGLPDEQEGLRFFQGDRDED